MPNRIIKESLCTSDRIASLTDFEFRLWVGLITQADDAGRGDARPAILKGSVFPLRGRATAKDIQDALHGLAARAAFPSTRWTGSPTFGSLPGRTISGFGTAGPNIPPLPRSPRRAAAGRGRKRP